MRACCARAPRRAGRTRCTRYDGCAPLWTSAEAARLSAGGSPIISDNAFCLQKKWRQDRVRFGSFKLHWISMFPPCHAYIAICGA